MLSSFFWKKKQNFLLLFEKSRNTTLHARNRRLLPHELNLGLAEILKENINKFETPLITGL